MPDLVFEPWQRPGPRTPPQKCRFDTCKIEKIPKIEHPSKMENLPPCDVVFSSTENIFQLNSLYCSNFGTADNRRWFAILVIFTKFVAVSQFPFLTFFEKLRMSPGNARLCPKHNFAKFDPFLAQIPYSRLTCIGKSLLAYFPKNGPILTHFSEKGQKTDFPIQVKRE